jgi:hypothetical protein
MKHIALAILAFAVAAGLLFVRERSIYLDEGAAKGFEEACTNYERATTMEVHFKFRTFDVGLYPNSEEESDVGLSNLFAKTWSFVNDGGNLYFPLCTLTFTNTISLPSTGDKPVGLFGGGVTLAMSTNRALLSFGFGTYRTCKFRLERVPDFQGPTTNIIFGGKP